MAVVQRRAALRSVCAAYKTVSHEAALIVAEPPPVDLLASRRYKAFDALRYGR